MGSKREDMHAGIIWDKIQGEHNRIQPTERRKDSMHRNNANKHIEETMDRNIPKHNTIHNVLQEHREAKNRAQNNKRKTPRQICVDNKRDHRKNTDKSNGQRQDNILPRSILLDEGVGCMSTEVVLPNTLGKFLDWLDSMEKELSIEDLEGWNTSRLDDAIRIITHVIGSESDIRKACDTIVDIVRAIAQPIKVERTSFLSIGEFGIAYDQDKRTILVDPIPLAFVIRDHHIATGISYEDILWYLVSHEEGHHKFRLKCLEPCYPSDPTYMMIYSRLEDYGITKFLRNNDEKYLRIESIMKENKKNS